MDLTREQPIPLYYQLKTLLTKEILNGVYGTDGRLPTEQELCERFGLSRTPVTHALTDLAAEGAVLRRRRHGTFVNPHWLTRAGSGAARVHDLQERELVRARRRSPPHMSRPARRRGSTPNRPLTTLRTGKSPASADGQSAARGKELR